ncbi:MAG: hypothetical protein J3R72DRAFT_78820 [Linnemannia gamsii]|nr:MAG: hypothetical protein J3R72DRAFT_78820 [Linnemannia gamsii]
MQGTGVRSEGSIRTNGIRVQLLAFKMRELQDVRYRRLPENRLPPRLTSTVGGTNYYFQEIRNVITSKDDIERLWPGINIEDIRTLTLDAGQACVIGGFAHLPAELSTKSKGKEPVKSDLPMVANQQPAVGAVVQDPTLPATAQESATSAPMISPQPVFFNVAVKSKAVYQPNFRFRRWLENEKKATPDGEDESVQDIETRLPPLKGQNASIVDYVKELELVETRLLEFYSGNDNRYDRHVWDMQRARHMEFQCIADQLLKVVGGGIGLLYDPSKPALIGVGLGEFSSGSGLTSLHSSFLSYFIQMVSVAL